MNKEIKEQWRTDIFTTCCPSLCCLQKFRYGNSHIDRMKGQA